MRNKGQCIYSVHVRRLHTCAEMTLYGLQGGAPLSWCCGKHLIDAVIRCVLDTCAKNYACDCYYFYPIVCINSRWRNRTVSRVFLKPWRAPSRQTCSAPKQGRLQAYMVTQNAYNKSQGGMKLDVRGDFYYPLNRRNCRPDANNYFWNCIKKC